MIRRDQRRARIRRAVVVAILTAITLATAPTATAIRELRIGNRDGGALVAKVGNLPAPDGGWLVSEIEATLTRPTGETEVWSASLGYAPVGDRLLFEHVALKLTDADGHLLRKKANDVNPISYYFSNCRILDAAPAAGN